MLREVARRGSFTAGGQALGFTQSAVSRQVSALEDELGTRLFDRLPRGVRLTEEGRAALVHAEAALERLDAARRDIAALRGLAAGRLRMGAFPTAETELVPRATAAFRTAHPAVSVGVTEGPTHELVGLLRTGEIDLAVITAHPDRVAELPPLALRHLLDDPILVAPPQRHPLAHRGVLGLGELAEETWIADGDTAEETLLSACLRKGFRPRIDYVAREWTAKQGFVAAGLAITLVPSLASSAVRPDIVLAALHPDDAPIRAVYTATAPGVAASASVEGFVPFLVEAAAAMRERAPGRPGT
ncbi:LysR family transcriptional regulator [Wenjunlia tyrosinilytica]|uniref:LysR family transcriptional regulator n=1 Tax=Wenjunlia tyrosinilytica TaxID=1544741 RepID=A0A918DZX5_9ACTN|nr:LysR family transcriptional regulator [Wenjunlia tyrosinilytica]GGO91446.1 LysR family transcriptional regulator [Wenjunlia tyrosinilytica]